MKIRDFSIVRPGLFSAYQQNTSDLPPELTGFSWIATGQTNIYYKNLDYDFNDTVTTFTLRLEEWDYTQSTTDPIKRSDFVYSFPDTDISPWGGVNPVPSQQDKIDAFVLYLNNNANYTETNLIGSDFDTGNPVFVFTIGLDGIVTVTLNTTDYPTYVGDAFKLIVQDSGGKQYVWGLATNQYSWGKSANSPYTDVAINATASEQLRSSDGILAYNSYDDVFYRVDNRPLASLVDNDKLLEREITLIREGYDISGLGVALKSVQFHGTKLFRDDVTIGFNSLTNTNWTTLIPASTDITGAASAITFTSPDTISDSNNGFIAAGFKIGQPIMVSGSTSNDGYYTITDIAAGTITVASGITTESTAGPITIEARTLDQVTYRNDANFDAYGKFSSYNAFNDSVFKFALGDRREFPLSSYCSVDYEWTYEEFDDGWIKIYDDGTPVNLTGTTFAAGDKLTFNDTGGFRRFTIIEVNLNPAGGDGHFKITPGLDIAGSSPYSYEIEVFEAGGKLVVYDDLQVNGDLIVGGLTSASQQGLVYITFPWQILNYGETGSGITGNQSGIKIDRGLEQDATIFYHDNFFSGESDEYDGTWIISYDGGTFPDTTNLISFSFPTHGQQLVLASGGPASDADYGIGTSTEVNHEGVVFFTATGQGYSWFENLVPQRYHNGDGITTDRDELARLTSDSLLYLYNRSSLSGVNFGTAAAGAKLYLDAGIDHQLNLETGDSFYILDGDFVVDNTDNVFVVDASDEQVGINTSMANIDALAELHIYSDTAPVTNYRRGIVFQLENNEKQQGIIFKNNATDSGRYVWNLQREGSGTSNKPDLSLYGGNDTDITNLLRVIRFRNPLADITEPRNVGVEITDNLSVGADMNANSRVYIEQENFTDDDNNKYGIYNKNFFEKTPHNTDALISGFNTQYYGAFGTPTGTGSVSAVGIKNIFRLTEVNSVYNAELTDASALYVDSELDVGEVTDFYGIYLEHVGSKDWSSPTGISGNMIGVRSRVLLRGNYDADLGNMYGFYSNVYNNSDTNTLTNQFAYYAKVTQNATSETTNSYLYYGNQHSNVTNPWGIYMYNSTNNFLEGNLGVEGHIIPATGDGTTYSTANDTYDLGATGNRWRDVYIGPSSLHMGTTSNDWTIYKHTDDYLHYSYNSDLKATLSNDAKFKLFQTTGEGGELQLALASDEDDQWHIDVNSSDDLRLWHQAGTDLELLMFGSGLGSSVAVGINTISIGSGYTLDVNGDTNINGDLNVVGALTAGSSGLNLGDWKFYNSTGSSVDTIHFEYDAADTDTAILKVSSKVDNQAEIQIEGGGSTGATPSSLTFRKWRGSDTSKAAIQNNDQIGTINFKGYNSGSGTVVQGARIETLAEETWSTSGQVGTSLRFQTAEAGDDALTTTMVCYADNMYMPPENEIRFGFVDDEDDSPYIRYNSGDDGFYIGNRTPGNIIFWLGAPAAAQSIMNLNYNNWYVTIQNRHDDASFTGENVLKVGQTNAAWGTVGTPIYDNRDIITIDSDHSYYYNTTTDYIELELGSVTGGFGYGDSVAGPSGAGTVISWNDPNLNIIVLSGSFSVTEEIIGSGIGGHGTIVDVTTITTSNNTVKGHRSRMKIASDDNGKSTNYIATESICNTETNNVLCGDLTGVIGKSIADVGTALNLIGVKAEAYSNDSAAANNLIGLSAIAKCYGSATSTSLMGIGSSVTTDSAGTPGTVSGNVHGLWVSVTDSVSTTGSIVGVDANLDTLVASGGFIYGVKSKVHGATASAAYLYHGEHNNVGSASKYGIYLNSGGSTMQNVIDGSLMVGSTSDPLYKFEVSGNAFISDTVKFGGAIETDGVISDAYIGSLAANFKMLYVGGDDESGSGIYGIRFGATNSGYIYRSTITWPVDDEVNLLEVAGRRLASTGITLNGLATTGWYNQLQFAAADSDVEALSKHIFYVNANDNHSLNLKLDFHDSASVDSVFNIDGDVIINGKVEASNVYSNQTYIMSISPAQWSYYIGQNTGYSIPSDGTGDMYSSPINSTTPWTACGINLPDGATITGMTAQMVRPGGVYDSTVTLHRVNNSTTATHPQSLAASATCSTNGITSNWATYSAGTLNILVNNSYYSYWLRYYGRDSGQKLGTVRIYYTLQDPSP